MSARNCDHPSTCRHSAWLSFHAINAAAYRDEALERAQLLLDPDEQQRAARLRPANHRARWVMSHAIQRTVLATHLGCDTDRVRYQRSPTGRPSLLPLGAPDALPDFNVSHSGDVLLLGIATCGRIGVDVESWMPEEGRDREPLWETLSTRETRWVGGQSDPFSAFVRLWTRKEAIVKAIGAGLSDQLSSLDVLTPPQIGDGMLRIDDGTSLRVTDLKAPSGFHAAAAFTVPDLHVHVEARSLAPYHFLPCQ